MHLLNSIPLQVDITWVKSHYTGPNRELPHELNEIAHSQANHFLLTTKGTYKPSSTTVDPPHRMLQSS